MADARTLVSHCWKCFGKGNDPENTSWACPECDGTGKLTYCYTCGKVMPCGARKDDASPCLRRGCSDTRTYEEIVVEDHYR